MVHIFVDKPKTKRYVFVQNVTEANVLLNGYIDGPVVPHEPRGFLYMGLLNVPEDFLPKYVNWNERGYVTPVKYQVRPLMGGFLD